ncbi:MAG: hypothetical protein FJZ95_02655 [Chloroflexi bacterium]|nr:hypothetical protein [Chloroflexota bacterium]
MGDKDVSLPELRGYVARLKEIVTDVYAQVVAVHSLPQREPFTYNPVKGNCVLDTAGQYSTQLTTDVQNVDKTLSLGTYEPLRSGKIGGLSAGGTVTVNVPVYLQAVAGTPNAKLTLQARNKGGAWVDLMPLSANIATSTIEICTVINGKFPTVVNFNAVPFDLQLLCRSDHATYFVKFRVGAAATIDGYFEPGT